MSGSQLQVRLYRDSFNTPWGFRLQGGKDLGQPLSIQRVFSNSPAEGELQRGDLILAIGGREGQELTHKQAQDLIKHGGGQIQLVIQRPAPGRVQSTATFKPQRPRAPSLQQPPASSMPSAGSGFQPKKVTLSRLGGGGPEYGSDYSSYRPGVTQPVTIQTRGPPGQHSDMLNRVQESLDNISLSPRTPDYYQPPPFASPTSPQQYIPTAVRLDMEREQEMRNKHLQPQFSYPGQEFDQPQMSFGTSYVSTQPYTPTSVILDQQAQGEDEGDLVPVHERRKAFMNPPRQTSGPISPNRPPPRVPKPQPGKSPFQFGVDYNQPQPKTSTVTWKPQPVQRPVNVPPPVEVYQTSQPSWKPAHDEPDVPQQNVPPAWRTSLKSTGVKPWDTDLEYTAGQQQAPRSAAFVPPGAGASFTPQPQGGGQQDGPNVVHLQYNSPIGLYSRENVQETYAGQTKALAAGAPSPGGTSVQNPAKPGDRDWTQSAVYRMIYEDEHRGRRAPPPAQQQQQYQQQQQQQQQQHHAPPPPAPKPQAQTAYQQPFRPMEDDFGTSDF